MLLNINQRHDGYEIEFNKQKGFRLSFNKDYFFCDKKPKLGKYYPFAYIAKIGCLKSASLITNNLSNKNDIVKFIDIYNDSELDLISNDIYLRYILDHIYLVLKLDVGLYPDVKFQSNLERERLNKLNSAILLVAEIRNKKRSINDFILLKNYLSID